MDRIHRYFDQEIATRLPQQDLFLLVTLSILFGFSLYGICRNLRGADQPDLSINILVAVVSGLGIFAYSQRIQAMFRRHDEESSDSPPTM